MSLVRLNIKSRVELETRVLAAALRQSFERGDSDGVSLAHKQLFLLLKEQRPTNGSDNSEPVATDKVEPSAAIRFDQSSFQVHDEEVAGLNADMESGLIPAVFSHREEEEQGEESADEDSAEAVEPQHGKDQDKVIRADQRPEAAAMLETVAPKSREPRRLTWHAATVNPDFDFQNPESHQEEAAEKEAGEENSVEQTADYGKRRESADDVPDGPSEQYAPWREADDMNEEADMAPRGNSQEEEQGEEQEESADAEKSGQAPAPTFSKVTTGDFETADPSLMEMSFDPDVGVEAPLLAEHVASQTTSSEAIELTESPVVIQSARQRTNMYDLLEVSEMSSNQEIHIMFMRKVRRLLIKINGSSRNQKEWLLRDLRNLWIAHDILTDPVTRTDYDFRDLGVRGSNSDLPHAPEDRQPVQSGNRTPLRIGELLQCAGLLEAAELEIACDMHKAMPELQFGAFLVRQGFILERDLESVLVGQKLLRKGSISVAQFQVAMELSQSRGVSITDTLVERGYISESDLATLAEEESGDTFSQMPEIVAIREVPVKKPSAEAMPVEHKPLKWKDHLDFSKPPEAKPEPSKSARGQEKQSLSDLLSSVGESADSDAGLPLHESPALDAQALSGVDYAGQMETEIALDSASDQQTTADCIPVIQPVVPASYAGFSGTPSPSLEATGPPAAHAGGQTLQDDSEVYLIDAETPEEMPSENWAPFDPQAISQEMAQAPIVPPPQALSATGALAGYPDRDPAEQGAEGFFDHTTKANEIADHSQAQFGKMPATEKSEGEEEAGASGAHDIQPDHTVDRHASHPPKIERDKGKAPRGKRKRHR